MIQSQAGYDLGCDRVHVTSVSPSAYVASGCGSSARYFVDSEGGIIGPADMHSDDETLPPGPPLPAPAALLKPPSGAGGFAFGASEEDVRRTCEQAQNAYATQAGGHGSCDGVAADVGAAASARMTYCHGTLCGVSLRLPLAPHEDPARALLHWKAALVAKYGGPSADHSHVPASCTRDVTPCLLDGTGTIRFDWRWPSGQGITLSADADDKRTPSLDIAYTAPESTPRGAPGL